MPPTITNVNPPSLTEIARDQPVTFDVDGEVLVVGWVKYTARRDRILIYDGTAFVEPFEQDSFLVGDTFTVIPNTGWLGDIESLEFVAVDSGGDTA